MIIYIETDTDDRIFLILIHISLRLPFFTAMNYQEKLFVVLHLHLNEFYEIIFQHYYTTQHTTLISKEYREI